MRGTGVRIVSDINLETLATEYDSARYSYSAQLKVCQSYQRAEQEAWNALVEAIIEAGLAEYGPVTSELVWHAPSESHRRIWKAK